MDIVIETLKIVVPTILAFVAGRYLKALDRHKERDKETFEIFLQKLPVMGGINYIIQNFMSNGLMWDKFSDLRIFVEYNSNHPEFYFIDKCLEKKKVNLAKEIKSFLRRLQDVTETVRDDPLIIRLPQQHTFKNPDDWVILGNELDQKTSEIHKIYSELVKEARKKL